MQCKKLQEELKEIVDESIVGRVFYFTSNQRQNEEDLR